MKTSQKIMKSFHHSSAVIVISLAIVIGPRSTTAQRALGIDVSGYQGDSINWTNVKDAGISFAWTKAAEGIASEGPYNYPSLDFTINEANAEAAGVLIGAYYYAHPEQDIGMEGADTEAVAFWDVAWPYIKNGGTYMMPALDLEADLTGAGYTQATLSQWVNRWCQDIVNDAAANGIVVKPIIYTYISYANGTSGYGPGLDSTVTQWPLWMASYDNENQQTGAPAGISPWSTWTFWQYSTSGSVPGLQDVFNGTAAGLLTYVIGGSVVPPVAIMFATSPADLEVTVDGTTYTTPTTFNWTPGSQHTLSVPTPQYSGLYTRYQYSGAQNQSITCPSSGMTITAPFSAQFDLTVGVGMGGTTSSGGWYDSGTVTQISATASTGYSFSSWAGSGSGSYSGTSSSASITMNGPITETASFTANPENISVTVQSNPSGCSFTVDETAYTTSQTFSWVSGSSHTITTTSPQSGGTGIQYLWSSWSDGGAISHTVSPTSGTTYTANFTTQYYLTMNAGTGGGVSPSSGWCNSGAGVGISATPNSGYSFSGWSGSGIGSYSGTSSFTSVTMNAPIAETASFTMTSIGSNVVFSDDFSGNSIDPTKWTTSGNTVLQSNQTMEVLTTVTDSGGSLTSLPFQVNPTNKITITRQAFLHYGNDYFIGGFLMSIGALPRFAVDYANMDYSDGVTYMRCHGFFLTCNNSRADYIQSQTSISTAITPLWDTWFNETVTYDPTTGIMEYFTNDVSALTFNVGIPPATNSLTMTLSFNAWGWYTGHEQFMSNLVVTQNGPAPQTGALQVTITPAAAITAGAQWQVDGGTWQASGATVSGLSAAHHSIGFNAVSGWSTPTNQTVSITAGSTASAIGTYMAVTSSNVVFSDNFSGSSIDLTKWTTSGNTVIQTSQTMEVLTTVTDGGGSLTSQPFPINPTGKITITRQAFLHYGNDFFIGAFLIGFDSLPWFGVDYANMDYSDGVTYMPCHGFFLMRNGTRADIIQSQTDISAAITPLWDTWFNEEVTYDPTTGVMEYFTNDVSALTFNVGTPPATNAPTMTLSFNAWGWYTGHEQLFQNLVVSQAPPVSLPPQLTGVGVSTNGMFQFNLNGPSGSNYVIQTSFDLVNWVNLITNVVPSGGSLWCAFPLQSNQPQVFYRALPLP